MMPRMRDELLQLARGTICSPSMELQQLWGQDDIYQPKQNQYFQLFKKTIFSLSEEKSVVAGSDNVLTRIKVLFGIVLAYPKTAGEAVFLVSSLFGEVEVILKTFGETLR